MPFICKCQKVYKDKTFKFELYFDSNKSSTDYICIYNPLATDFLIWQSENRTLFMFSELKEVEGLLTPLR